MFQKWSPFLAALLAAIAAALGVRLLPAPTTPPPTVVVPPVVVPPPATPPPPPVKPDTLAAIGRIQLGNSGCTATIIGTKRADKRYWVLTAAHCIADVGQRGAMRLRDGREFGISVLAFDRRADCCWMLTDPTEEVYPHAAIAVQAPQPGEKIWHAGFGVHVPSNREEGVVVAGPNGDGQIQFKLSVSSGDSGGGVALNANGEIVSCVCCTTAKGVYADVWGASPESCRRLRPEANVLDSWTPLDIPLKAVVPTKMPAEK